MNNGLLKLGVDVGGTNTDAAILDSTNKVIASVKLPTTHDVESGIYNSIQRVVEKANVEVSRISLVSLGTTHATNAIIRRKSLSKVAVVRISLPAGRGVPPFTGWDEDLITAMGAKYYFIHGGYEYDGRALSRPELDSEECERVIEQIKRDNVQSIAISCIFSPVKTDHEKEFASYVYKKLGEDIQVTLSSEIGSLGLLERENSSILNASVVDVARNAANGLTKALEQIGIDAKIFFAQNDGTLMALKHAIRYPILTIGSGPTNSTRGAAYISDLKDCIVVDIGGTSTDVGILVDGFPRQSSVAVEVGGVLTNFRMPDLISIGLGGGSIVTFEDDEIKIGPDSVGHEIREKAICFGGDVLTATDLALAAGIAKIDDPNCKVSRLKNIDENIIKKGMELIITKVLDACDRIKTSPHPVPIVLVGGGSILIPENASEFDTIIKPNNFGCANAIGAAIADASGEVDALWPLEGTTREEIIHRAKEQAIQKAVEMGARKDDTKIVDVEAVPLSYLPGNVMRVKAKAAGTLDFNEKEITSY